MSENTKQHGSLSSLPIAPTSKTRDQKRAQWGQKISGELALGGPSLLLRVGLPRPGLSQRGGVCSKCKSAAIEFCLMQRPQSPSSWLWVPRSHHQPAEILRTQAAFRSSRTACDPIGERHRQETVFINDRWTRDSVDIHCITEEERKGQSSSSWTGGQRTALRVLFSPPHVALRCQA